jgi:PAS domain-containing protein
MSQHDDRRPLPSASEQRRTDALRLIARARAAHDTIEVPGRDPTNDSDGDSNDLGRRIVEASADCTFVLTMDGLIQFTNENGRRLLAVDDADQVIGRSWHELAS